MVDEVFSIMFAVTAINNSSQLEGKCHLLLDKHC